MPCNLCFADLQTQVLFGLLNGPRRENRLRLWIDPPRNAGQRDRLSRKSSSWRPIECIKADGEHLAFSRRQRQGGIIRNGVIVNLVRYVQPATLAFSANQGKIRDPTALGRSPLEQR